MLYRHTWIKIHLENASDPSWTTSRGPSQGFLATAFTEDPGTLTRTVKTGKGGRKEPTKDRKTGKKNKVKWSRGAGTR